MEHFIEGFLEFLFSFAKKKPDKRPETQYKNEFIIRHKKVSSLIVMSILLIVKYIFLFLAHYVDKDTSILFLIFYILFSILFFLSLCLFSINCRVTEKEIVKQTLFFFKKTILWADIICLRIIEKTDESEVTLALYGKNKKLALDVSSQMENAWYLVNMAEEKQIEIKTEKDLSLKQLSKL